MKTQLNETGYHSGVIILVYYENFDEKVYSFGSVIGTFSSVFIMEYLYFRHLFAYSSLFFVKFLLQLIFL